jgi:hypothetical protein
MTATTPQTIELVGVFAHLLGAWYPEDYVVAAIDGVRGAAAKRALVVAGFGSGSVHLYDSARVSAIGASIYEQRTPMQRAGAAVSGAITEQGVLAGEYLVEADAGASIIAVLCSEPGLVDDAGQVLGAHGARMIRYYGANTITDLI